MRQNSPVKFSKQRGIALLFALAILSLLLVMVVSFTTDSIFEHKSAYNAANVAAARLLAEAEVAKVITLLKDTTTAGLDGGGVCWSSDGTITETNNDNLKRLQTMEGGSYVFEWKDEPGPALSWEKRIKWQNIVINDGTTNRIIGRTAYVLLVDPGVDPGALVSTAENEAAYPEKRIGKEMSEINIRSINSAVIDATKAMTFNYGAQGGSYTGSWISFANLFSNFAPPLTAAEQSDFRKWFVIDPPAEKEAFWIDLNGDEVIDDGTAAPKENEYFNRFNLNRGDWNTFVVPPTGHPLLGQCDIYREILLDNNGDGVPDIDKNILLDTDGDGTPDPGPVVIAPLNWSTGWAATGGAGIQWLALFGYKTDGSIDTALGATFGSNNAGVIARRQQIAANLVDYCDADSVPTSDINPNSWTAPVADPRFTGNEKTPYINEIGFRVETNIAIDTVSIPLKAKVTVDYSAKAITEIINIYAASYATDLDLLIKNLRIELQITVGGGAPTTVTLAPGDIAFNGGDRFKPGDWSNGYAFKQVNSGNGNNVFIVNNDPANPNNYKTSVTITSVTFDRAVLYKSATPTECYDYVKSLTGTPAAPGYYVAQDVIVDTVPPNPATCVTFETYDPRQNLNAADWNFRGADLTPNIDAVLSVQGPGPGYLGKVNSLSSPVGAYTSDPQVAAGHPENSSVDKETATDPANAALSTAFIRNGPMESPWELGFIHRGEKWQTINLKKYDKSKVNKAITIGGRKFTPGGGAYNVGDANILDQIKMGDSTTSKKKIQLKTRMYEGLYALFDKVKLSCTPDGAMSVNSMATTGGTDLTSSEINKLCEKIMAKDLASRGGVADIPEMSSENGLSSHARATDAKQEELIGKIINLTDITDKAKVLENKIRFFTLIVLAQSVKDVGGAGVDVPFNKRKSDGSIVLINSQLNRFDYVKDGSTYYYADDITGEQKIKVRGYRDDSGKITIFSYEYVE